MRRARVGPLASGPAARLGARARRRVRRAGRARGARVGRGGAAAVVPCARPRRGRCSRVLAAACWRRRLTRRGCAAPCGCGLRDSGMTNAGCCGRKHRGSRRPRQARERWSGAHWLQRPRPEWLSLPPVCVSRAALPGLPAAAPFASASRAGRRGWKPCWRDFGAGCQAQERAWRGARRVCVLRRVCRALQTRPAAPTWPACMRPACGFPVLRGCWRLACEGPGLGCFLARLAMSGCGLAPAVPAGA